MQFISSSEQTHGDDDHMVNSFKEVMKVAAKEDKNLGAKTFLKEDISKFFRQRFAKARSDRQEEEQDVTMSTQMFEMSKALRAKQSYEKAEQKAAEERENNGTKGKKAAFLLPDAPTGGDSRSSSPSARDRAKSIGLSLRGSPDTPTNSP